MHPHQLLIWNLSPLHCRTNCERKIDGLFSRVEAFKQKRRRYILAILTVRCHTLLPAISFGGNTRSDRQRQMMQDCPEKAISCLYSSGFIHLMEVRIPWRPKLSPLLESDLQKIAVYRIGTLDPDHTIDKPPASPIFAWAIHITGCITCRPDTLRTVFAPWKRGASIDFFTEPTESSNYFGRNLLR